MASMSSEELKIWGESFEAKSPQELLAAAIERYAPKIVVRAEQPDVFMADRNKNVATILRAVAGGNGKPLVEGAFLEVQDANGKWLTVSGYVVPTGSGVGYTNPTLPKP